MGQHLLPVGRDEPLLVTGAGGFIGTRVVSLLLDHGYRNIRCFARPSRNTEHLLRLDGVGGATVQVVTGNLLRRGDCIRATEGVPVIFHLAAGKGLKSFSDAYLNSVVTTRNLVEAALATGKLLRFVNISSFSVYTNRDLRPGALLSESCPMEPEPVLKGDAYTYAKIKQDDLVMEYGSRRGLKYVILRPGVVYGPGVKGIHGRVGIDTFGPFLHMGGGNRIPLTYIDNCAEAIVLAGLAKGVDGEVFNVVDDDLPTSRQFLQMYKKNVRPFRSYRVPKMLSRLFCDIWEKYVERSDGQLPPVFNRRRWAADWKGNTYSNHKMKQMLGWKPLVSFSEASRCFFDYCRTTGA